MSCLYSSPELNYPNRRPVPDRRATGALFTRSESRRHSESVPISSTVVFNKDAFPIADVTASEPFVQPVKTSPVFLRRSSSAISGFRSICGRKRRSFRSAIALNSTRVSEPFTRHDWQGKPWYLARFVSGPAPVLWPERSRSERIFQEVFASRTGFRAAFFGPQRPGECPPGRFWEPWPGLVRMPSSKPQFVRFGHIRPPRPPLRPP